MGQDGPNARVRMQVNAWGRTYAEVRTLADQVSTRLSRFRGTVAGTVALDILLDNELASHESESTLGTKCIHAR